MNGLVKRYKESLDTTPAPVMPSQIVNTRLDFKGLLAYAKSKKISPVELSDEEKLQFVVML